jgi:uncharacterized protein YqgC (DUF456 family)
MTLLVIAIMVGALLLTPLGAPGNWIMLIVVAVAAFSGRISYPVLALCVVVALIAEVIEWMILKRMTGRYGGSKRAFWGAIAGGIIGVIVGVPVPIIGSVIAGFIGSFAGAAVVTYMEARDMGQAGRVGWGVLMGRMLAAAVKTAAGIVILVAGAAAMLS